MNRTIFKTTLIGMFGSLSRMTQFFAQHPSYAGQAWSIADNAEDARAAASEWFRYRVMPQLADDSRTRRARRPPTRQKSFFDA